MELIDLISELLYRYNCVIIPKFGGFVANIKETEFNENRMLLSPPRKKVAFNRSLQENDGLLINGLMQRKDITYDEAQEEVESFARYLRDQLIKYKNYEFKNLGSFYLNQEDNLVFVAYEGLNFYKKSYGLQEIKVRKLSAEIGKTAVDQPVNLPDKDVRIVPLETGATRKRNYLPQLGVAASIVVAFGVVLFLLLRSNNTDQLLADDKAVSLNKSEQSASMVPELNSDSKTVVDESFENNIPQTLENDIQPVMRDVTEEVMGSSVQSEEEVSNDDQVNREMVVKNNQINANEIKPVAGKASTSSSANGIDYSDLYQKALQKETVFYVAISRETNVNRISSIKTKIESADYNYHEIVDESGIQHQCVDRFLNQDNAYRYLALVKRYDYPGAYLVSIKE